MNEPHAKTDHETPIIEAHDSSSPFVRQSKTAFDPSHLERPDGLLLRYYVIISLLSGPFFPIVFLPLYFKYITLRYKFDESGVSMSWGILFRREIHLTYRRIQDIHLNRNVIQRWLKLATLGIQTASASATPEMSIEGILEADALRDYLYAQMRGARGEEEPAGEDQPEQESGSADDVSELLVGIRDGLRDLVGRVARLEAEQGFALPASSEGNNGPAAATSSPTNLPSEPAADDFRDADEGAV